MEDVQKLKMLAAHWKEHNSDHAASYKEWSDRMRGAGAEEAEIILRNIADRTVELNCLFDDLIKALS